MERQGTGIREQGTEGGALAVQSDEPTSFRLAERVRELEAENARLKSLIGELLVANQLLREGRQHGKEVKG
jgi:hypothetical protein